VNQDIIKPAQDDSKDGVSPETLAEVAAETPPTQENPPLPPKSEPSPLPPTPKKEEKPEKKESNPSEDEIQNKKEAFQKKIKLLGFIVIGAIAVIALYSLGKFAYNKTKSTYSAIPTPESTESSQEIIKKEETPINTNEWEIYSSEKYGFSFDYPKGDSLTVSDNSEDSFVVQVLSQDIIPENNATGENLVKGFIFQITPLKLESRDLESAVNVKRDSFVASCPETADITDIVDTKISDLEGRGFKIYSCNADYSVNYVAYGNYIYEITQIFKGDVGFKQVYKAKTNQILQSINIEQNIPDTPTHIAYASPYGFSFLYPSYFDSDYVDVPEPPQVTAKKLIVIAENDNTNAAGFFYAKMDTELNFESYVQQQTQLLIDDYTVVKGRAPDGIKTELTVDTAGAVVLTNYTWEGNTLIFIPLNKPGRALVISKTNMSDELFNNILESIELEKYED